MRHQALLALFGAAAWAASCQANPRAEPARVEATSPSRLQAPPALPLCSEPNPPLITDFDILQTPSMEEPRARAPFRDPVFGTCVVRLTDRHADLAPGDPSRGLKNEYSRVQSFNADGSRILLTGLDGTWYLYDASTLAPLGRLPFGGPVEPRWDASDPGLLYFIEETRLMSYRLGDGAGELIHDFAEDFPGEALAAVWTRYEGSPSADGQTWGLMAEDTDWLAVALLVYDLGEDRILARRNLTGLSDAEREIDSVSISPLGDYLVAYFDAYCEPGALGTDAHPCGIMVYDRELTSGRGLARVSTHSDLALNAEGHEVMIYDGYDTDSISLLDLATGATMVLWPVDFTHCTGCGTHYSGRAFRRPGWALVSTHDADPASFTWMDDEIFALELRPGGQIVRLAHTHSLVDPRQDHDYWAEPQATVNADFTRVLFTSNWGRSGTEEVETFLLDLPADWPEQLP